MTMFVKFKEKPQKRQIIRFLHDKEKYWETLGGQKQKQIQQSSKFLCLY